MLDQAFVEEIIPVLIAESTHPTVKGITTEVIRQLGLRGRAAVAAERRVRPMVIDALREHFGDEDAIDEDFDEELLEEDEDNFGYDDDDDDAEDSGYAFDENDYPVYGDDEDDYEDEEDELDGYSYKDEDDEDEDDL